MSKRRSKKSETIEVRLEHEVKSALMRKAQNEGRSTSAVVRTFIDFYLADKPKEARSMLQALWKPTAALGAATLAVAWAAISPAPVHAQPDLKAVFQALDRDGNGSISSAEFVEHKANPAIVKMHEAQTQGHAGMAAMHGQGRQADHKAPSADMLQSHFRLIDANADGTVDFSEFQAFHDRMKDGHKSSD